MTAALVIGVGNPTRGDDGAGVEVARRVGERSPRGALVLESSGEMASLLEAWRDRDRVVVIDAAAAAGSPGTVRRFEAHAAPLPASLFVRSSHALGLAEAVEMARSLGELPREVVVYAIEGGSFRHGRSLSKPVRRAVERVEKQVLREIRGPG
jgi:hydrogenase maturation protease